MPLPVERPYRDIGRLWSCCDFFDFGSLLDCYGCGNRFCSWLRGPEVRIGRGHFLGDIAHLRVEKEDASFRVQGAGVGQLAQPPLPLFTGRDRKSTRLNSSHGYISYAVFCLKKKKTNE